MLRKLLGGCVVFSLFAGLAAPASAQLRALFRDYRPDRDYDYRSGYGRDAYSPYGLRSPAPGRYQSYYRGSYDRDFFGGYDRYGYGGYRNAYPDNAYGSRYYPPVPYRRHEQRGAVRIVRLLPDVSGRDDGREVVTLYNAGPEPIDLRGWWLQDRHQNRFPLGGVIGPRDAINIRTDGSMPMNNGGDTVMVVDPAGGVVDSVTYYGNQVRVDRPIDF